MDVLESNDESSCALVECAQVRADLKERADRYRWLVENTVDVIVESDVEGIVRFASPAAERVLGYRPEEVLGTSIFALIHPGDVFKARETFAYVLQNPGVGGPLLELRGRHKDGSWRHVEALGKSVAGESHQPTIVFCLRDVTASRQAEAALADRNRQLEAIRAVTAEITHELDLTTLLQLIHQRASELITGTTAGSIYLWDDEEKVLVCRVTSPQNAWELGQRLPLNEGLIGLVAARLVGMSVDDYRRWPGARSVVLERTPVAAALAEPLLYRGRLVGVLTIAQDERGHIAREENRQLLSLFATQAAIAIENARLFTMAKQSLQDLQQAQATLVQGEKLRALGQLAAGVAHDLNNMLAAVLGQAELIRIHATDPVILRALQIIYTAASDGAQVVRRLQGFGRRQSEGPHVPCDLATLVNEALDLTRPRWQDEAQRQHRLIQVWTVLEGLPRVLGNPAEIREVLTNLILNAVDAMPTGGNLTITGDPAPVPVVGDEGEAILLTMTDTGTGLCEEVRQRMFEPFFTTKGLRGTGLGLAVAYGIMERHGGKIDVTSTLGQGTTFTLRFQAAPKMQSPIDETAKLFVPVARRLLVIDDEAPVRQAIANLLRAVGHTVFEAENGPEGLAFLAEDRVDLVLSDLGMLGMTGWEVAQRIKAAQPQLPVILLTGWGQHYPEGASDHTAVDRVLAKPIHLENLQAAIAQCTSRKP